MLLAPAVEYLKGYRLRAVGSLNKIADDEDLGLEVRRAAYFLSLALMRKDCTASVENGPSPHFLYWDNETPSDVAANLRRFERQAGSDTLSSTT